MTEVMTVEQIDKHIEKYYVPKSSGKRSSAGEIDQETARAAVEKVSKMCVLYGKAKPVIDFAVKLLFFKPKWQRAVEDLLVLLDDACPSVKK